VSEILLNMTSFMFPGWRFERNPISGRSHCIVARKYTAAYPCARAMEDVPRVTRGASVTRLWSRIWLILSHTEAVNSSTGYLMPRNHPRAMTERILPNVEIIFLRPRSAIIPGRKSEGTLQRAPASQDDLPATSSVYRGPGLLGLPGTLRSRCCSLDWLLEVAPWFGLACANTKFVLSSMRMAAMPAIGIDITVSHLHTGDPTSDFTPQPPRGWRIFRSTMNYLTLGR
jgi:hypothetical protein